MSIIDRSKLLRRLCPGDQFQSWQQALDLERIPGSCQWFFDDPKLKDSLSKASSGLIWLHGPSATGKTFLSSCLVHHIRTDRGTTRNAAVACVYFQERHKQYDVADFNHAFASVLRQLVSQLPDTSDTLRKLELAEYGSIPRLGEDEFTRLLHMIAGEIGKVLIILDGVAADVSTKALTDLILAINPDGGSDQIIQILFTSQAPPPQDFATLHQIVQTPICASDTDIEKYIVKTLQSISGKNLTSSHSELVQGLVRTFDGRFLPVPTWPTEMPLPEFLAAIKQLTSACKDISFHDKVHAFSQECVLRIKASQSEMVICTLYHAVMAAEAGYIITVPMVVEALKTWKIYRQDEDERPLQLVDVVQGCRGLVIWGKDDQSFRIRSPLFGDYLKREVFGADYDKRWVTASLRYLSSDNFANGASKSSAALKERFRENTYLWFASRLLGLTLAKAVPETFVQDFKQLSSRRGSIESYQQAAGANPFENETSYDELEEYYESWHCFTTGYSPLHLAAHLDAPAYLVDELVAIGEDLEARDCLGRTALHLAAETEGDISVMRSLVAAGANVSAKDDDTDDTPLANAVIHGGPASVKFLLEHGADINELDGDILEQCGQENPDVAVYMRNLGIDVPASNENGAED